MKIEFRVNPSIWNAAMEADAKKAQTIIDNVQTAWDAGESFLQTGNAIEDIFSVSARKSDSEEEIAAAAKAMQDALTTLAVDGAMCKIGKDAACTMCSTLLDVDPDAALTLHGVRLPITEFQRRWNAAHPGDEFYLEIAFEL